MRDLSAKRSLSLCGSIACVLASVLVLQACGSGGGAADAVREVLCGSGHARGVLTVGLDLSVLEGLKAPNGQNAKSDAGFASLLNSALAKVVNPEDLNVSSVSSAVAGDSIRFLKLGGNFGAGFGIATSVLRLAAQKSSPLSNVFRFVREGYLVGQFDFFDETLAAEFEKETRRFSSPASFLTEVPARALSSGPLGALVAPTGADVNAKQWALAQTDFESASKVFKDTTREVRVAVVDTGVDAQHPDLKDVLVPGYNALDGSSRTDDDNGHGTHCAGIIASQAKSGTQAPLGVAARANVKIIPIKVLSKDGAGSSDAIEKGIRWAVKQGKADVLSLSLGGGLEFETVKKNGGLSNEVIKEALDAGVIVVVAAGNEGCPLGGECKLPGFLSSQTFREYTVVPCAYEGTLCVGATDPNEALASYSNFSSKKSSAAYRTKADVNAPGSKIYSTWPLDAGGPYKAISGTSMATPYVAGVAALLKANAKNPADVDQAFVRSYLSKGLVSPTDAKVKSGTGRVDLYGTAYAFSTEYLKEARTDLKEPSGKPNGVKTPGLPDDEPTGGGSAIGTVWSLLCAL
ncbi:MAG: S8 family serine peptidase [Silvanigrellales bacterium]|nr:S8 family serine peptidase [Silvanigrellales bacterium]